MSNKTTFRIWTAVINLCRFVLAATFIFSGFVKAVDPNGMAYKLEAYFQAFGWESLLALPYPLLGAEAVAAVEFMLGVGLLLGARRKLTSIVSFVLMLFMTALTAYVYVSHAVPDCGCFADAWVLTDGQTLAKNIVLLSLTIPVLFFPQRMVRLVSERHQWMMVNYALIFVVVLSIYSAHYLPVLDFGRYKVGTNLQTAVRAEYKTSFTYRRGHQEAIFDINHLPDTSWTYVSSHTQTIRPTIIDNFLIVKGEEDKTDSLLENRQPLFLITSDNIAQADDGVTDRLNDLADFCADRRYALACLTSSDSADVEEWKDRTGATYPFYYSETGTLREMVRSNPGLVLLWNGVIVRKWSSNNLPDEAELNQLFTSENRELAPETAIYTQILKIILWFVVPLLLVILTDLVWRNTRRQKHKYLFNPNNMRKKIVAGNWKMNKNLQEGIDLAKELNTVLTADKPNCGVVICTPFIHLASVSPIIDHSIIGLGAENCADKASGAYTGEVSAEMVKSTGAEYVILGHSERRAYYHETAEILKEKVNLALANGLKVIFCIGEVLEDREAGKQNEVVKSQLEDSLFDLTEEQFSQIILAYEPVWAIGTGKTATAEQAQDMHAFIRGVIADKFGAKAAEEVTILYGGSCKPSNAKELFAKPDVDGGLIGGAALKAADFKGIIDAWK